jgi:hypothetical protein
MKRLRVLIVEPDYRRQGQRPVARPETGREERRNDETLWYPPLGLMKLSRFHKDRGDEVRFVYGCDAGVFSQGDLFIPSDLWDRVYITTLFTFHFDKIVRTIRFYRGAVGGSSHKIFVGGIMASLMAEAIFEETGITPIRGVLNSPEQIGLVGTTDIDRVTPDYELLDSHRYAINETYYGYTTRGCTNKCPWCGVPKIEPTFVPYIDIKPIIRDLRGRYGDKPILKLMDNNILASPQLPRIVADLLELGYGRGDRTDAEPKRQRVIDFNQGLDATHLTEEKIRLIAQLNVRPMRIAFDRLGEKRDYVRAVTLAEKYGVEEFSNYMLYNFEDSPRELYERLLVNIELNERLVAADPSRRAGRIYSYPMRYAPIVDRNGNKENRTRDAVKGDSGDNRDWLKNPVWTKRFVRNIEIMKGAAYGAISPTPSLARRAIGVDFEEFLANLYMPEELLRNRNRHEKRVYADEPNRKSGTGKVEAFRAFILGLLRKQDERFKTFHGAVAPNAAAAVRETLARVKDREVRKWLKLYVIRHN